MQSIVMKTLSLDEPKGFEGFTTERKGFSIFDESSSSEEDEEESDEETSVQKTHLQGEFTPGIIFSRITVYNPSPCPSKSKSSRKCWKRSPSTPSPVASPSRPPCRGMTSLVGPSPKLSRARRTRVCK